MLVCASYIRAFFFFNDTATTEIYTLSLHDALPISHPRPRFVEAPENGRQIGAHDVVGNAQAHLALIGGSAHRAPDLVVERSEEHTSELQSHLKLVCRLFA